VVDSKKIRRAADALLRERLGVESLDEAAAIVAAAKKKEQPAADAGAPVPKDEKAKAALAKKQARIAELKKRVKRARAAGQARAVDLEIQLEAARAGVLPDEVDYATSKLRSAWAALDPAKAPTTEAAVSDFVRTFFTDLKAKKPHIFSAGSAPPPKVPVTPTTAPPESAQPGGGAPPPAARDSKSGTTPDVDKMSPQEFENFRASTFHVGRLIS
jgi:hypothetical protein